MNGAHPRHPIKGKPEVSNTLIFYGEGGALTSAADQSPQVDDRGGSDAVLREHCIHRELNWDAGDDFASFCDIGLNDL